jgi:tetratricopeptide (TPR) repeat protein
MLMLAAVAASCAAFAQTAYEPSPNEQHLREILDTIEGIQKRDGPASPSLADPLTALALLYQEGEERDLAAAAFSQALHVVRVNHGLYSLEQAPLIRHLIRYEQGRGNPEAAWDLEHDLLALVARHPNDLRVIPILRDIGDARMDTLRRYLAGEFPAEIVLGCYYAVGSVGHLEQGRKCTSGSRSVLVHAILTDAWENYSDAINVFFQHDLYSSDELRELEAKIIRSTYLYGGRYRRGKTSYQRLMAYNTTNSESWLTRVTTGVEATDWDFLYMKSSGTRALDGLLEQYEQAYALLEREGVARTSIERLFSPPVPVVLPTFVPNPLASNETPESVGYIDVAFDIAKYGTSRRIKILDTTTNATDAATDRLVRIIKRSRFRPRVTNGKVADSTPVVMRYYLNE